MLLNIPTEVLYLIFEFLIYSVGIRDGLRLRHVCRLFNLHVLESIYALPTFENNADGNEPHLSWDFKMSKPLISGLIHAKLKHCTEERPIVTQIVSTKKLIPVNMRTEDDGAYTDALIQLIVEHTPLHEIIEGLSKGRPQYHARSMLLENALTAALSLDRQQDVRTLRAMGASAQFRTKWFGDPLVVAAQHGPKETFFSLAENELLAEAPKRHAASRLYLAFEHAAFHGRAEMFCIHHWSCLQRAFRGFPDSDCLQSAFTSAILASQDNVVATILTLLDSGRFPSIALDEETWVGSLRLAASNGSVPIAQLLLRRPEILGCTDSFTLALEDACRAGAISIVELLLSLRTDLNLSSYAGAMFWAARNTHYDTLSLLVRHASQMQPSSLLDALCGASIHGIGHLRATLHVIAEAVAFQLPANLNVDTFAGIVDELLEAGFYEHTASKASPKVLDPNDFSWSLLDTDQMELANACANADFSSVRHLLRQIQSDYREERYFEYAVSESIAHENPGILQYLCEKISRSRQFTAQAPSQVRSTALLQVLLDRGWKPDTTQGRIEPPILGLLAQDVELARWLLTHGADPNARCDFDITPLSTVIRYAPFTTIRLMLQHHADVRKGQTLFFATARSGSDQLAVIDMLLAFGANVNRRMFENDAASWLENRYFGMGTPLHTAVKYGNAVLASYFLEHGADSNLTDSTEEQLLTLRNGMVITPFEAA
ncbi:hypothetical protein AC578_6060 [Pseudocercospora eumusae]|uniref:Uncharacterized protein n=1 Tax=Pseudocercospora eumusae TaxID=321146 RepID=A0A139HVE1_9PEZI|nr:hypothetical protein AC578_6060 [Pseudocercospora eumusae]